MCEEECGDEAHSRAHEAYNHGGDAEGYKKRTVLFRVYEAEGELDCKPFEHEHLEDDCDRPHNRDFMERDEENPVAHTAHLDGDIVAYHGVDHDECHDGCEDKTL